MRRRSSSGLTQSCTVCGRRCRPGLALCDAHVMKRSVVPPDPRPRRPGKTKHPVPFPPGWKHLRREFLDEYPLCERCGRPGNVVDHVLPRRHFPELSDDWHNLQTMCRSCHARKGPAERRGELVRYGPSKPTRIVATDLDDESVRKKVMELMRNP